MGTDGEISPGGSSQGGCEDTSILVKPGALYIRLLTWHSNATREPTTSFRNVYSARTTPRADGGRINQMEIE